MASRNTQPTSFETMDKLPSNTLKRHPKMELNRNDLLRLLSYLEGELQARDIAIAALNAEKTKHLLYQAKYGRFGLGDPFLALQRDSKSAKDSSIDEAAIRSIYDNQLAQLENLIDTQKKAQHRMREQLCAVEKHYHKVIVELEDEKRKHAQDTAQGDDVTYMLEKERERLKQEIDFEKTHAKKLEKDLKKSNELLKDEQTNAVRHKQVAILLIKERKKLIDKLVQLQQMNTALERAVQEGNVKMKSMAEGLVQESKKALQMETILEKQLSEFDVEREELRSKLMKEHSNNHELLIERDSLRQQVDKLQKQLGTDRRGDGPQSIEIKSSVSPRTGQPYGHIGPVMVNPNVLRSTPPNTPPGGRRYPNAIHESPERDYTSSKPSDQSARRAMVHLGNNTVTSPTWEVDRYDTYGSGDTSTPRFNISASNPGGATVFTTPSGGKISVQVGPPGGQSRKVVPAGRGNPPPIPPNKPIYVPQPVPQRKDPVLNRSGMDSVSPVQFAGTSSGSARQVSIPVSHHTSGSGPSSADNVNMRKSSQVCVNVLK